MAYTKVWIAGPRAWEASGPIRLVLSRLANKYGKSNLVILQGEAPGVDTLAKRLAERNGIWVVGVRALWDTRGRSAGPQRNAVIAALGPQLLVAFHYWEELIQHPGTFSAATIAHDNQIPVKQVYVPPERALPSSISDDSPMGNRARAERGQPPKPKKARKRARAIDQANGQPARPRRHEGA